MKLLATLTVSIWLATSVTLFGAWCVRVFITSEIGPEAHVTARLIWYVGRTCIWAAAALLAGGLAGAAAFVVARAMGG